MRKAVLLFILLASTVPAQPGAAPQTPAPMPRQAGLAARRLTSTDLHDITSLVSAHGQPWMVIADWPQRDLHGWQWTVEIYMFPASPKGTVVRGSAVVVTAQLSGPDSYSTAKSWQISATQTYADVPPRGEVNFLINTDRDPRRPFITKPSDRWGQLSDTDLIAVVGAVHTARQDWTITEVAVMDQNLVSVEAVDSNPARDDAASILLERHNGEWRVTHSSPRRVPSPARTPMAWGIATRGNSIPAGVIVALAAGLNLFGLWAVFSAWKSGRGSPQFILGLLPVSLMFLVAPVPAVIFQMIRDFASFAPSGGNAAAMLSNTERGFVFGAFGFVLSLTAAAALQWHAGWEAAPDDQAAAQPSGKLPAILLTFSAGVALPVFLFNLLVERLPRTFMEQVTLIMRPTGTSAPPDPEQVTRLLSSGLVLGFIGGIVGAGIVALVGVMTLILVRSNRFSSRMTSYAWVVLAFVAVLGLLNLTRVVMDLNWLSAAATRLPL